MPHSITPVLGTLGHAAQLVYIQLIALSYGWKRTACKVSYPRLGENGASAAGVGIGVDVTWCSPRAIVLQGFTGSGTRSRLLLDGRDLGDVVGEVGCPATLEGPAPWVLPSD